MIRLQDAVRAYWPEPVPAHVVAACNVLTPAEWQELKLSQSRSFARACAADEESMAERCRLAGIEVARRLGEKARGEVPA